MRRHGVFPRIYCYMEEQAIERGIYHARMCVKIKEYACIYFCVTWLTLEWNARPGNQGCLPGWGLMLLSCIILCKVGILHVLCIRVNFWLGINELKAISRGKIPNWEVGTEAKCYQWLLLYWMPWLFFLQYFSIFNPTSLMSTYWFKMGQRIFFFKKKRHWQSQ